MHVGSNGSEPGNLLATLDCAFIPAYLMWRSIAVGIAATAVAAGGGGGGGRGGKGEWVGGNERKPPKNGDQYRHIAPNPAHRAPHHMGAPVHHVRTCSWQQLFSKSAAVGLAP